MTNPASDLRDLAAWVDYCAEWIGGSVGSASGDRDRATRIVSFEGGTLNEFLIGFRRLGPELEQIASALDDPITVLRGVPGIREALADRVPEQGKFKVIVGGRQ